MRILGTSNLCCIPVWFLGLFLINISPEYNSTLFPFIYSYFLGPAETFLFLFITATVVLAGVDRVLVSKKSVFDSVRLNLVVVPLLLIVALVYFFRSRWNFMWEWMAKCQNTTSVELSNFFQQSRSCRWQAIPWRHPTKIHSWFLLELFCLWPLLLPGHISISAVDVRSPDHLASLGLENQEEQKRDITVLSSYFFMKILFFFSSGVHWQWRLWLLGRKGLHCHGTGYNCTAF